MAYQETGKQRASRIPLDYYKRPNPLESWKTWLALAAMLVTVGWLIAGMFQSDEGRGRYSRGPVAKVHAIWEDNCNACHEPFAPINGDSWASGMLTEPHSSNQKCSACHAGPPHQKPDGQAKALAEPDCASCHFEHRGREASLVRLLDSACTQCHRDLANHGAITKVDVYTDSILQFVQGDHPDFRSIKVDPGHLKFSHKRHLTPGMGLGDDGKPILTLNKIPNKEDWKRYGNPHESEAPVKLECASCHQLDSKEFQFNPAAIRDLPAALLKPARGVGAYMLPITYEIQCSACHPLTFDGLTVRHRIQPGEVFKAFDEYYAAEVLKNNSNLFKLPIPVRPLPGKLLGDETQTLKNLIEKKTRAVEAYFFKGRSACSLCHEFLPTKSGQEDVKSFDVFKNLKVQPTDVPSIWFKHALFDHAAHRAVECRACHAAADGSSSSKDVLIPAIANCVECHAPQTRSGGKLTGGASYSCTECHRYHGGGGPMHGIGANDHGVEQRRNIEQFLQNRKSP